MGIEGNLQTMALPDIFQWLANGRYTGTLLVSAGEVVKSIYFRDGEIVSCTSTNPKEFLGHFLVSHGYLDETSLAAAVSEQEKTGELLGNILVEQGAISTRDLERMLALKAEESIFELFHWDEGQFRFVADELPKYEMVPISLNVTSLTLEGIRRIDEWNRIKDVVPSPQCVPVSVGDLLEGETDESRRAVLELVDDDRSVEEIGLQTHSSEYFVCEILFQKARQKLLKVVRPRTVAAEGAAVASAPQSTSAVGLVEEARELLTVKEYELALRRMQAAVSLEPDNSDVTGGVRSMESEIRAEIEGRGVDPAGVPRLKTTLEAMQSMDFSPQEAFILSRISGASDIGSILKISPLPELEALIVFWKLLDADLIEITFR
jgi:hypothetical protein